MWLDNEDPRIPTASYRIGYAELREHDLWRKVAFVPQVTFTALEEMLEGYLGHFVHYFDEYDRAHWGANDGVTVTRGDENTLEITGELFLAGLGGPLTGEAHLDLKLDFEVECVAEGAEATLHIDIDLGVDLDADLPGVAIVATLFGAIGYAILEGALSFDGVTDRVSFAIPKLPNTCPTVDIGPNSITLRAA